MAQIPRITYPKDVRPHRGDETLAVELPKKQKAADEKRDHRGKRMIR